MSGLLPKEDKIYYLASPFSSGIDDQLSTDAQKYIMELRYQRVVYYATQLIKIGYTLFEPIAMGKTHEALYGLPASYEFWKNRDRLFISRSDGLLVAPFDGWKTSTGVQDEITYAESLGLPIYYVNEGVDYAVYISKKPQEPTLRWAGTSHLPNHKTL